MAIHTSIPSMLQESLVELISVAEYCITFRKNRNEWGSEGCYGYPAAILLFSIADSIGSYFLGGRTRDHFNILIHEEYYNLNLDEADINLLYGNYRNLLTHNSALAVNNILDIGEQSDPVFCVVNGNPKLNLVPFLELSKQVVEKFLNKSEEIVNNSEQLRRILNR